MKAASVWPLTTLSDEDLDKLIQSGTAEKRQRQADRRKWDSKARRDARWRAMAAYVHKNGPTRVAVVAREHGYTERNVRLGVKDRYREWFCIQGGKLHLTNEGRREALVPKKERA